MGWGEAWTQAALGAGASLHASSRAWVSLSGLLSLQSWGGREHESTLGTQGMRCLRHLPSQTRLASASEHPGAWDLLRSGQCRAGALCPKEVWR